MDDGAVSLLVPPSWLGCFQTHYCPPTQCQQPPQMDFGLRSLVLDAASDRSWFCIIILRMDTVDAVRLDVGGRSILRVVQVRVVALLTRKGRRDEHFNSRQGCSPDHDAPMYAAVMGCRCLFFFSLTRVSSRSSFNHQVGCGCLDVPCICDVFQALGGNPTRRRYLVST